MPGSKTSLILALILFIQILAGCGGGTADNTGQANANTANAAAPQPEKDGVKDNYEELGALVKMPFEPEDLAWKEYAAGKQGKRLLAVFQLTAEDAKKLVERASKIRPATPVTIMPEKWFPTELVSQSEMTGDEGIPATSYAADEFFQPPYSEGSVSRVADSDFFVLEVFAKQ